jgi:hypothetical protein
MAREGQGATNSGTFADVGHDPVTLSASVGTVTANANGTWSWSFGANGGPQRPQTVTITATDDDGASASVNFQLTFNSRDGSPEVTSLAVKRSHPELGSRDGHVIIIGTFVDTGVPDAHTVVVSWGDGTPAETLKAVDQVHGHFKGRHHYVHGGVFTITVTVSNDGDGQAVNKTTTVVVRHRHHRHKDNDSDCREHHWRWTCSLPTQRTAPAISTGTLSI